MAWTTPRTWTTGETVTDALMNTHVRDQLNFLYTPPAWYARSTDYAIAPAVTESPALFTLAIPDSTYQWEAELYVPATYSTVSGDRAQYKLYLPDGVTQCGGGYVACLGGATGAAVIKGKVPSGQSGNITATLYRAGGTGTITMRCAEGGYLKLTRMS